MKLFERFRATAGAHSVQTAPRPMEGLLSPVALHTPEYGLFEAMRARVPVIDAAIDKIVRLTGGFAVECSSARHQTLLDDFVENVRVGAGATGLRQFSDIYLDSLLTYGNAVGEIVPDAAGRGIYGLYNTRLQDVRIRMGNSPFEAEICATTDGFAFAPVKYPGLVLFTPLRPPPGEVRGVSLLRSLPFVTEVLMKIYASVGTNFERIANLRYAVTYRPGNTGVDRAYAREIAESIALEWGEAMRSTAAGQVRDFVTVGDVGIRVIGADNQMIDTEIPVRQMLEQIVAKLGIPPFMLGLHWSTTERMSTQQADILTSELESYRALLAPVLTRVCTLFLQLAGVGSRVRIVWNDINLQDELESANARLISAQARQLEQRLQREEDVSA